jgi:hypothetical protein
MVSRFDLPFLAIQFIWLIKLFLMYQKTLFYLFFLLSNILFAQENSCLFRLSIIITFFILLWRVLQIVLK